jgi:hypothetical protein
MVPFGHRPTAVFLLQKIGAFLELLITEISKGFETDQTTNLVGARRFALHPLVGCRPVLLDKQDRNRVVYD